jgi:serine palmitoyltransferase
MPHQVHAWPSVAGVNASALPFLILRWRYGSMWVWEMDQPWQTVGDYSLAFLYMFAIALSRMGNGDSPANVQGGIVVGAVMLRCLLPHIDWAIAGLDTDSVMTSQGFTLVGLDAHFSPRYFASKHTIKLMTAIVVHGTNLTPGSEQPCRTYGKKHIQY